MKVQTAQNIIKYKNAISVEREKPGKTNNFSYTHSFKKIINGRTFYVTTRLIKLGTFTMIRISYSDFLWDEI